MKLATGKESRKAQAKRKCGNQGEVLPGVSIGRHTPGPSTDDVSLLMLYDMLVFLLLATLNLWFCLYLSRPAIKACMEIAT
jgi:hypothetical protein